MRVPSRADEHRLEHAQTGRDDAHDAGQRGDQQSPERQRVDPRAGRAAVQHAGDQQPVDARQQQLQQRKPPRRQRERVAARAPNSRRRERAHISR
jgi:hypothetical protein